MVNFLGSHPFRLSVDHVGDDSHKKTNEIKDKKGKRESIGNVQQYMISQQAYKLSQKQALGIFGSDPFQEYRADNPELKKSDIIRKLRTGELQESIEWYDSIKDFYHKMKGTINPDTGEAYKAKKIKALISRTYYGSK